ncbi:MAG: DoxX family protein [Steroidobacteraceae bacterium]|jgi:transmembrane protein
MRVLGDMTAPSARSASSEAPSMVACLLDNPVTLVLARVFIILPFLVSGLTRIFDWQAGVAEMLKVGLHPAWAFNAAVLLTQLGGSLLIITNRKLWLGAGALGVFTVLTNFIAHRFWEFSGDARAAQLNSFLEHWTMSAAFILVVVVNLRDRRPLFEAGS